MSNVFFTADTHFRHEKVITFESTHRKFTSIEEHDEALIANWNKVVRPKDLIWHLGDVYLGNDIDDFVQLMSRLNGRKMLIRGNHDTFATQAYTLAFEEVYGVWPKYGAVLSHVPLHPDSVDRWKINIHGHLHSNVVKQCYEDLSDFDKRSDNRYICVSVEQTQLFPISLDTLRKQHNF